MGFLFISIWFALIKSSDTREINPLLLYAPIWSIIVLGIYAVGSIIIGLISFKDTPEAAAEIDRQVIEAKAEMKKRGIISKDN
jgi:dolichyl-phosphate mannosyltransferase polypeptide 3